MLRRVDVLVVEDSDLDAELTLQALREAAPSTSVWRVKDGAEALNFLFSTGGFRGRFPALPQLVFLEWELPVCNGLSLLECLREDSAMRAVPVIVFSSTANPLAVARAEELGARSYVVKPRSVNEYFAQVRRIAEEWSMSSPPMGRAQTAASPRHP